MPQERPTGGRWVARRSIAISVTRCMSSTLAPSARMPNSSPLSRHTIVLGSDSAAVRSVLATALAPSRRRGARGRR